MQRVVITNLTPDEFRSIILESARYALRTERPSQEQAPGNTGRSIAKAQPKNSKNVCDESQFEALKNDLEILKRDISEIKEAIAQQAAAASKAYKLPQ